MYGECWFTGKLYFKHGGSQNATLSTNLQKAVDMPKMKQFVDSLKFRVSKHVNINGKE